MIFVFKKENLCQLGFSCEIYAMSGEQNAKEHYRRISELKCKPIDLIIDHIGGYSDYVFALVKQPCRRVLLYHNITPPEFVSNHTRRYCKRGLEQIPRIQVGQILSLKRSNNDKTLDGFSTEGL